MPANPSVDEVKALIIESLSLEGMTPDTIADEDALFGEGLGLDSVDALELVVAMEKAYGIKIRSNEIDPAVFSSAASLARFIAERLTAGEGATA
jgi:acyl carrier protein